MKTVWVNRHNADGTLKPISEWVQACVRSETTHVMFEDGRIFQGTRSDTFTSNGRSGVHEHIGDQRGDGWFYVADGDLPPIEDNTVLCHDGYGLLLMMPADLHRKNAWNHRNKAKCWMPVTDPRHLD
ncbi:hypothetical protein LVJ82_00840 [Vitreoscilla massiliensis]|uniref:Cupin n=1 Tax=Vitreoscilla massiliensis TaxID=1689272 RepID=A0ABY4E845_9NEIS|nr:hypothetical protein [Vitreoscilla massiliensis]UOO89082.1 hypothetical protein LVJ82_16820 [Vitreoscilla massiliensis]UOO89562.1 hypothetical protein LVJ82_00840 [Vitreoscilla massiliensis]